ncbi:MAG: hypothetical protein EHM79_02180 [Geobacter sp.]|nr:MAG: hypothetical protein EHM79_02180 [Geobacter sp.]
MGLISIGSWTPSSNPSNIPLIRPKKPVATVETYSNVGYFSWPPLIAGQEIPLIWDFLPADEFVSLDALYVADAVLVFNPNDDQGKTYNVNLIALDGEYHILRNNVSTTFRKNVTLALLIMSEVA